VGEMPIQEFLSAAYQLAVAVGVFITAVTSLWSAYHSRHTNALVRAVAARTDEVHATATGNAEAIAALGAEQARVAEAVVATRDAAEFAAVKVADAARIAADAPEKARRKG
jgi:hypothetical protein